MKTIFTKQCMPAFFAGVAAGLAVAVGLGAGFSIAWRIKKGRVLQNGTAKKTD